MIKTFWDHSTKPSMFVVKDGVEEAYRGPFKGGLKIAKARRKANQNKPMSDYTKTPKQCCNLCGWTGLSSDRLIAKNPFDPERNLTGCPTCKSVDDFVPICDFEGCYEEASCEIQSERGSKLVCPEHWHQALLK